MNSVARLYRKCGTTRAQTVRVDYAFVNDTHQIESSKQYCRHSKLLWLHVPNLPRSFDVVRTGGPVCWPNPPEKSSLCMSGTAYSRLSVDAVCRQTENINAEGPPNDDIVQQRRLSLVPAMPRKGAPRISVIVHFKSL
jgi:hypothetical protein